MKLIKKGIEHLTGDELDFRDRQFILLTVMVQLAIMCVFVADIILGENIVEIIVLGASAVFFPILFIILFKLNKLDLCRIIIAINAIFVVLPVCFFYGGGTRGGSLIWYSLTFFYVGIILSGKWRSIMLSLIPFTAALECYIGFKYSKLVFPHSSKMAILDTLVSVIIVGLVIYIMTSFQNLLFINENKKARMEAEKVEEMSKAQNRFFSNMSHEIRTPINTIIGFNEMILREDISEEVAEDAANIEAAGKILLHLINDILDMSKIQSGQMELAKAAYNPGDMLSEIVAMMWMRARDKELDFHVNVSPDIPAELIGDEVRIKQILINIVNNAIKYTREGSVTLTVQCGEKSGDSMNIIYTVSDTGIGIRKESLPHLFNAFRRVDEDNNRYIEGTGLGLSIVKQLVDLMGGRITVNSIYTQGSTFIVEIPQDVSGTSVIGELDMASRNILNGRETYRQKFEAPSARLLVVDDNESNLLVARKLLRATQIQIDTASSGREALELTLNNEYNVIFMDHLMPEMDGIECLRNIRAQAGGKCRETAIVALTANAGEENRQLYRKAGFDSYIEKPVSGNILESELYRLLPKELVHKIGEEEEITEESMSWMETRERKRTIAVTTESVADLPQELLDKYGISVIEHKVVTDEGIFRDRVEIDTDGLLRYMEEPDHKVSTQSADVADHESFFANALVSANNIIHISISGDVTNSGYPHAVDAARSFGNVTVVDSRHLSSGQGIVALKACALVEEGKSPNEIKELLGESIKKIHTSFIVNNLDFLARAGQVSHRLANLMNVLMIRPVLVMKKGRLKVGKFYLGAKEKVWKKYIDSVLVPNGNIDRSILFVTYVGLTKRDKELIRSYIDERMKFDKIYFQKTSPAIAVNCGEGTFGLLFTEA